MIRKLLFVACLLALAVIAFQFGQIAPKSPDKSTELAQFNASTAKTERPNRRPVKTYVSTSSSPTAPLTQGAGLSSGLDASLEQVQVQELLNQAASNLETSQSLQANLRFKIDLFGQEIAGPGFYVKEGQGSGRWRMELQHSSTTDRFRLAQVCDGRFFYRLEELNDEQTLSFVDLNRLSVNSPDTNTWTNPWSQIGGLPSSLRHIATHFEFEPAKQGKLDQIDVYRVIGKWKPESIRKLFPAAGKEVVNLNSLPPHVPHVVQLVLGTDNDLFPLFPYRLIFYRYEKHDRTKDAEKPKLTPVIVMEFFNLKSVERINPAIFEVESPAYGSTDVTEDYVEQATRNVNLK